MHEQHSGRPADPYGLLEIDSLLTSDERAVRDAVRDFCDRRVEPNIARGSRRGPSRTSAGSPRNSVSSACWACTWKKYHHRFTSLRRVSAPHR